MPVIRFPSRYVRVIAVLVLACSTSAAYSQDSEAEHAKSHRHHVALFGGFGLERASNGHEENGTALAFKYHYRLSPDLGIGVSAERLFGNEDANRAWAIAFPLTFDRLAHWKVFAGPGVEYQDDGPNKFMIRLGVAYEVDLVERWSLAPEFSVDLLEGGDNVYVLGLALAYGF